VNAAILGRTPPHSIEAEEYLLSCCLLDGADSIKRCIETKLPSAAFYAPANRLIFERICALYRTQPPVELATLAESLRETQQLDAIGGFSYLTQISSRLPTTAQAQFFIEKIRELYGLRELIKVAAGAVEDAYNFQGTVDDLAVAVRGNIDRIVALGKGNPIAAELGLCLFDPAAVLQEPRVIYRIGSKPICTEGNLATVTAQAKAGKSAFVGAFISAAITRRDHIDALGIVGRNENGGALLHFDTEQSIHDHAGLLRRALVRSDREAWPAWFRSYQFAGKDPNSARALLDHALKQALFDFGSVHSVLIDGIGDLVVDLNDPKESFPFVTHLHAQAIRYQTSIISVLHLNPGTQTGKTRGHLGSQLERKAATNLLLEKDGEITVVWSEKQRGAPITKDEGPRFRWDDSAGMHVSCDTAEATKDAAKRERLRDQAESAFSTASQPRLNWGQLVEAIAKSEGIGKSGATKRFDAMKAAGVVVRDLLGTWRLA
jgi:hypothetical protein